MRLMFDCLCFQLLTHKLNYELRCSFVYEVYGNPQIYNSQDQGRDLMCGSGGNGANHGDESEGKWCLLPLEKPLDFIKSLHVIWCRINR